MSPSVAGTSPPGARSFECVFRVCSKGGQDDLVTQLYALMREEMAAPDPLEVLAEHEAHDPRTLAAP